MKSRLHLGATAVGNSSPGFEGIEKVTGTNVAGNIIEFIEKQVEKPLTRTKDKVGV